MTHWPAGQRDVEPLRHRDSFQPCTGWWRCIDLRHAREVFSDLQFEVARARREATSCGISSGAVGSTQTLSREDLDGF